MVNLLSVSGAGFSFDKKNPVFEGLTFSLKKGDIFCILGPNGVGKSTLIRCLCNFLSLNKGTIFLEGKEIRSYTKLQLAKKIGFIPQLHQPAFPFLVRDFVLLGRTPHIPLCSTPSSEDILISEKCMKRAGIAHLASRPYTRISGGERQLVMFARIMAQEPELMLLDEPTSHLDLKNQVRILDMIESLSRSGLSCVFTTHIPDHAFLLDSTVALMKNQSIIKIGPAKEVITEENMLAAYDIPVRVIEVDGGIRTCVPVRTL